MKKKNIPNLFLLIVIGVLVSVGVVSAATTISTDISTGGTVTVSGTANNLILQGTTTGNPVLIKATGSDSDVSLKLEPKGRGYIQLGPDTLGLDAFEGSSVGVEINRAAGTEPYVQELIVNSSLGDFAGGFGIGISSRMNTQGAGATQNPASLLGISGAAQSSLPAGRSVNQLVGGAFYVDATGGGYVADATAGFSQIDAEEGSSIALGHGFSTWMYNLSSDNGTSTGYLYYGDWFNDVSLLNAYGLWVGDMSGKATNPYYSWFDSDGVRRVREENNQAIEALYNPSFTKYTPGATNYERLILGQWASNVAQIGTENSGTGVARGMAFITASTTRMTIGANGNVGIGVTSPTVALQVATSTTNATSTLELGKTGQNKGSCLVLYDDAGTAVYAHVAAGASTFTLSAVSCK